MATPKISREVAEATLRAIRDAVAAGYAPPGTPPGPGKLGAGAVAASALGLSRSSMSSRLIAIQRAHPDLDVSFTAQSSPAVIIDPAPAMVASPADKVRARLLRSGASLGELKSLTGLGECAVRGVLDDLKAEGFNLHRFGDAWSIEKTPPLPAGPGDHDDMPTLLSRLDNTFCFGASGDQHLCSRYERLDVLNDLYDRFANAGAQAVYNTGNWIDGEARFNRHELKVHGMEAQCRYLARNFPKRSGLVTYAVAGDDHEGWYAQREGVDIGRFAERIMREEGRDDWVNLGFMEAHVRLVNANSGKSSILSVVHPGGGSAYALSYSIQKIIEGLDGGEKPAVGLYGHYHKLWAGNIRNVWAIQTGTTKDQDAFMRKKKIDAHVGGVLVGLEQDPATGAIIACTPQLIRYFNKGYYAGRWSYSDEVTLPARSP